MTKNDNPIAVEPILISKFNDEYDELDLTIENTPWLSPIIESVSEELNQGEQVAENTISASVRLKRDAEGQYGEYLWVDGTVSGSYQASCIRCLKDMHETFNAEFKGAFINQRFENDPDYEELDQVYINGDQADIFYHTRGKAKVSEIIKEAVFLAVDHYPVHDAACKGLCHTCGANLNEEDCGHQK